MMKIKLNIPLEYKGKKVKVFIYQNMVGAFNKRFKKQVYSIVPDFEEDFLMKEWLSLFFNSTSKKLLPVYQAIVFCENEDKEEFSFHISSISLMSLKRKLKRFFGAKNLSYEYKPKIHNIGKTRKRIKNLLPTIYE